MYDPTAGEWINVNPWNKHLHLGASEAASILYYSLMPDSRGAYTLKTDISYPGNGSYSLLKSDSVDLIVTKDLATSASDILRALNELDASNSPEVRKAKMIIQFMLRCDAKTRLAIETNINSVLTAINLLLTVNSDTLRVRAMLDELLMGFESRYYYLDN